MSEVKDDNTAKTLSAAARRSFFRRKHKHKRSESKDGKDLLALDTFSNDSIPLFEGKCWAPSKGLNGRGWQGGRTSQWGVPKGSLLFIYLSGSRHSGWQDGSENLSTSVCVFNPQVFSWPPCFFVPPALFQEEGHSESVRTWESGSG